MRENAVRYKDFSLASLGNVPYKIKYVNIKKLETTVNLSNFLQFRWGNRNSCKKYQFCLNWKYVDSFEGNSLFVTRDKII